MNKKNWVCIYIFIYIYTHTHSGILVIKKNEIVTHASTWMNLESIMLYRINQAQRDKYCVIPLT